MSSRLRGAITESAVTVHTAAGDVTLINEAGLVVNKTSGEVTAVTLPGTPAKHRRIWIKDGAGDAATYNITIEPASGTIDGAASYTISENYGAVVLVYNGTEWNVTASHNAIDPTELAFLNAVTAGTGAASKAMVLSAGGDVTMPSGGVFSFARAALAAAGSSATDAAALTQQFQVVTGADGAKGVALPAAATTDGPYWIYNDAAATLLVYPVNGGNDNINGLAEDAAFGVAGGEVAVFIPTSATQWYVSTFSARGKPTPMARGTVTDAGTVSAAQLAGRILYQDASGGNVTMTTRTGTQIAGDMPELRVGDAVQIFVASNHGSNTSTISGGTDVTNVGSGAVTQTGGSFILVKTAATTFDLVRVG